MIVLDFETKKNELTIRGKIYADNKPKMPAVILSHGFNCNYEMCEGYAKALANEGFACFAFDFCGGSMCVKSDGEMTQMSVLTEARDLETVIDYAKTVDFVDPDNISLLGCSQGGLVSAIVASKMPQIKNLLLLYPALCIPDDARAGHMQAALFDPKKIPDIIQCGDVSFGKCYPEAVMDMDPFEIVSQYKGRVLLIHGDADAVVNVEYARKAAEVIHDCVYREISGAGHVFFGQTDEMVTKEIVSFMKKGTL